ncbi:MAG: hypothetical protein EHV01_002950 [Spiroplasma sp. hy2]|uniref:hypothetical protein n=1 Tax=Spiroplasma sp. hy2 TaxID=2490850 RepID=UPI0038415846
MFDLNWNDLCLCIKLKYYYIENNTKIKPWFLGHKNQITEKQKTYIKNLFYQYYVPCSERQFEYFENKLNELNTRNSSEIINGLLQKYRQLISILVKYLEQFKPNNLT